MRLSCALHSVTASSTLLSRAAAVRRLPPPLPSCLSRRAWPASPSAAAAFRQPLFISGRLFSGTTRSCKAAEVVEAAGAPPLIHAAGTSEAVAAAAAATARRNAKAVGYWLLATAGAVFAMISLGGVTRLTRSGLSIVEWRPEGEALPLTEEEWEREFVKYQQFPEYLKVNNNMTLADFKPIYLMEWGHRMWGRAIGVIFAAPLAYFVLARRLPPGMGSRLGLLLLLGGAQGGVGWWMVKSGLEHERFADEWTVPRVSPYRLTAHLSFAFALYSALVWHGLDLVRSGAEAVPASALKGLLRVRTAAAACTAVVATTVVSGALVAGNDAGHAYNDWPLFAGRLVPEQIWESALGARNFTENTATVQFDHRLLAYCSLAAVGAVHMAMARAGGSKQLPRSIVLNSRALGGLVALQILLGITTLMLYVPLPLAALHQAGAVALLTGSISTLHAAHASVKASGLAVAQASGAAATRASPAAAAGVTAAAAFAVLVGGVGQQRERED